MTPYVTRDQASARLRRDTTDDDADLDLMIAGASQAVREYLNGNTAYIAEVDSAGEPILDSAGDPVYEQDSNGDYLINPMVQNATLMLIGYMYRERDGSNEFAVPAQWGFGYLPIGVTALLYPLRNPGVA